jgi:hypothetical protein
MSNEQFLIVSYFTVGAVAAVIGLTVYACLRRPLAGITMAFRNQPLGLILRRLFPVGLVLPALAGFLSVKYQSCGRSYATVIASREYLIGKNQEQMAAACFFVMVALMAWGIVVLVSLTAQATNATPPRSAK